MSITAIIIDDERLARKELTSLLAQYKKIEIIDKCKFINLIV